jgi:N-acetylglucosaminyl-diphospho-decaprenol L-rhamnosyltransferase
VVPRSELSPQAAGAPAARWSAVVVAYESGELLTECVRTLITDTSAGSSDVVVVDNGSEDGSVDRLRAAMPDIEIIVTGSNRGYAAGANAGIAASSAPVVAVCNADLRVMPGTAGAMLQRFDAEPDLGAVGPLVLQPDGRPYPSARRVPSVGDAVGHGLVGPFRPDNRFTRRYRELDADPRRARDVDWVSGAAVWLRRTALDAVGGWDDGYFMYVEDVDLCWRLRSAGWRVAYEPAGQVVHVQGASTARHPYRMIVAHHRSLLRFAAKRWRGWRRVLLLPAACFLGVRTLLALVARAFARSGVEEATG